MAILEARRAVADTEWVFPAPTRSGHVEKSSLKKQRLGRRRGRRQPPQGHMHADPVQQDD
jgi:hypothetical protein